jgi:hypothetical protein
MGDTSTKFTGSPESFDRDSIGTFTDSSFPKGWSDPSLVDPHSTAPHPSAVVIKTTDADGHSTEALATFPAIAESQGIYRPIDPTTFYKTQADVRIDQFGDVDPSGALEDPNNPGFLVCGCPVESMNFLDWPMQVAFLNITGDVDPTHSAGVGVAASTQTHTWHLGGFTTNIAADIDLGVPVVEGKWYTVETDFDATTSALHGTIIDATTGDVLADKMVFLNDPQYEVFGEYDPSVDGVFNSEAYADSELTLVFGTDPDLNKPGLAVVDNIDTSPQHPGNAFAWGLDRASQLLDGILSDFG